MEDERIVADDHGVAGVVAALVTHYKVHPGGEYVYDLTLALVAPLGANHDRIWHFGSL
jgi:hypothetical protein